MKKIDETNLRDGKEGNGVATAAALVIGLLSCVAVATTAVALMIRLCS